MVDFFHNLSTQWRSSGEGFYSGLDYAAVLATAKMTGFKMNNTKLQLLKKLESAYLSYHNKRTAEMHDNADTSTSPVTGGGSGKKQYSMSVKV